MSILQNGVRPASGVTVVVMFVYILWSMTVDGLSGFWQIAERTMFDIPAWLWTISIFLGVVAYKTGIKIPIVLFVTTVLFLASVAGGFITEINLNVDLTPMMESLTNARHVPFWLIGIILSFVALDYRMR